MKIRGRPEAHASSGGNDQSMMNIHIHSGQTSQITRAWP